MKKKIKQKEEGLYIDDITYIESATTYSQKKIEITYKRDDDSNNHIQKVETYVLNKEDCSDYKGTLNTELFFCEGKPIYKLHYNKENNIIGKTFYKEGKKEYQELYDTKDLDILSSKIFFNKYRYSKTTYQQFYSIS